MIHHFAGEMYIIIYQLFIEILWVDMDIFLPLLWVY